MPRGGGLPGPPARRPGRRRRPRCVATISSPPVTAIPTTGRALHRHAPPDCAGCRVDGSDPGLSPADVHGLVGNDGDHLRLARRDGRGPQLVTGSHVDRLHDAVHHVAHDDDPVPGHGECAEASAVQRLPPPSSGAVRREPDDHVVAACVVASGRHEAALDDRRREDTGRVEIQVPLLGSVLHCQAREGARTLAADIGNRAVGGDPIGAAGLLCATVPCRRRPTARRARRRRRQGRGRRPP